MRVGLARWLTPRAVNMHVRPGAFRPWAAADAALVDKGGPQAAQSMDKYVAIAGLADESDVAYVFSKPDARVGLRWMKSEDAAAEVSVSRGRADDVFGQYSRL